MLTGESHKMYELPAAIPSVKFSKPTLFFYDRLISMNHALENYF